MQEIRGPPAGAEVLQAVLAETLGVGRVGGKLPTYLWDLAKSIGRTEACGARQMTQLPGVGAMGRRRQAARRCCLHEAPRSCAQGGVIAVRAACGTSGGCGLRV
jgi:hypothetical protein